MVAVVGGQLLYVWDALYNEQASSRDWARLAGDWPEIGRRLAGRDDSLLEPSSVISRDLA